MLVASAGKALASRQRCYWKVKLWDGNGRECAWSEAAAWSMGLLDPSDWQGAYIGMDAAQGNPQSPWLRQTFELGEKPADARVYVNPLGYYELYVNGERVDDAPLSPAVTQFNKRSFYLTHDVTAFLREDEQLCALDGPCYQEGLPGVACKGPLVRAQLEADLAGGERVIVATDATWKAHPSGFECIDVGHPGHYGGERYDARAHNAAWANPEFDATAWPNAVAAEPAEHVVSAQPVETNALLRRYEPARVRFLEDKVWLVDFGTNLSGLFEITFTGLTPGQSVKMDYADFLADDEFDNFGQTDEYIARGGGEETFRNRFNYHAFRYVRITGMDVPSQSKAIAAYLVRTNFQNYGSFACSNPVLTNIHDMVHYTLECLSLGGYLVDCPHIERLGYGGDGQASTPTALTMFGMGRFYNRVVDRIGGCQRRTRGLPDTAPNLHAGRGPYLVRFIIAASWQMYQDYGDTRILEVKLFGDAATGWAMSSVHERGLLRPAGDDYRAWYWATARPDPRETGREVDRPRQQLFCSPML